MHWKQVKTGWISLQKNYASKNGGILTNIFLWENVDYFSLLKIVFFFHKIIILSNFIATNIPWEDALSGDIVPGVKMGSSGVSWQNLGCSHLADYCTPMGTIVLIEYVVARTKRLTHVSLNQRYVLYATGNNKHVRW